MLTFTAEDKRLLKELQQRVNDLENENRYLRTLIKGTGTPYIDGLYLWNADILAYEKVTLVGALGNEQLNITNVL